ncbi:single-stranded DNA-binding protein [Nocardioides limicola]|uniref:single-stranded DNA-binding protein n=1 Tax=Nocardioides limicola TaxID=2803368 RepID=UPI00193BFF62|nr:single-stranded DNA-binding protein [Nocardioides sp. DJM-14]
MNEAMVTLAGWLGNDVTTRQAGDAPVATFRLACTPRRYNRKDDQWVDADTQWYTVTAWRGLAENCAASLSSGDPVVVVGRLNATKWTNTSGMEITSWEVEALAVGHDLSKGRSQFVRNPRPDGSPAGVTDSAEPVDPGERQRSAAA